MRRLDGLRVFAVNPSTNHRETLRRIVAFGLATCLAGIGVYEGVILFRIIRLKHRNPGTTAFIEQRSQKAVAQGKVPRKQMAWSPLECISPHLVHAVISAEDPNFWKHRGLDRGAMWDALKKDWRERRFVRGGSTVDQQLAKNLYLSPSKNPLRKVQEIIVAMEMEIFLGKRRILEIYLNVIEWDGGIYGAEAAAQHYFNSSAFSLTPEQAAYLAAIIPGPRGAYNPAKHPDRVQRRASWILRRIQQSD
jgi:monofunctional biosynthetic peptidoglycan transglycosylase